MLSYQEEHRRPNRCHNQPKEGLVIIDNLKTEFGKRETIGYAKIYETEERAKQVERPHIIERNTFVAPEEAKKEA